MDVGFIVRYGKLVPGRETQAIELFAETSQWLEEQLKRGFIAYYEPFFFATGNLESDAGFWLIKGEQEKVWKLTQDEAFRWLTIRAQFVVDHLRVEWLVVGEGIPQQIEQVTKAAAEFAVVH